MTESGLARKGFILLALPYKFLSLKEVRTGTIAPYGLLRLLLHKIHSHQPRDRPTHEVLGPPISVTNYKNV